MVLRGMPVFFHRREGPDEGRGGAISQVEGQGERDWGIGLRDRLASRRLIHSTVVGSLQATDDLWPRRRSFSVAAFSFLSPIFFSSQLLRISPT